MTHILKEYCDDFNKHFTRNRIFWNAIDEKRYLSIEENEIDEWILFYEDKISDCLIAIQNCYTEDGVKLAKIIVESNKSIEDLLIVKEKKKKMEK